MTAQELLISAFRKAHVIANGESPSTESLNAGLDTFNDLLESWRDEGLDLKQGTLALGTTLTFDAGATRAVKYNLAVELANDEHVNVPSSTLQIAERSRAALQAREAGVQATRFPRALTIGRGNWGHGFL